MTRTFTWLLGPESVAAAVGAAVLGFCARHASGTGRDVDLMERLVVLLPLLVVVPVFLTALVPGAATWTWLARALVASFVVAGLLTLRVVEGFGSGAKGQDAAMIVSLCLTSMVAGTGSSIAGAMILAQRDAAFAAWFRARPVLASLLTLAASIPLGIALLFVLCVVGGLLLGAWSAFRR